jgi:hypothetical protein
MRRALSLTLIGMLGSASLVSIAAAPAAFAAAAQPCVTSEATGTQPNLQPTLELGPALSMDAPTRATLHVTCHNASAFTLTSGYISVKRAPRDAAEIVPATQLAFAPVTAGRVTPVDNGDGTWSASVPVDLTAVNGAVPAGQVWIVGASVNIPGAGLSQRQSFEPGAATPLALASNQSRTIIVSAGAHDAPAPRLPSRSALGQPADPELAEWGQGAELQQRWLDEAGALLATGPNYTPRAEGERFALEVTGTWADGTTITRLSNVSTASTDPLAGRGRLAARGDAFPFGEGLGYSVIRASDGAVLASNENRGLGAWYEVTDSGRVTGYTSPLSPAQAYFAQPVFTPSESDIGRRFVYIRNVSAWNTTSATEVVTIGRAKTPTLANSTGYVGQHAASGQLGTVRPGTKISLANPWPSGLPVAYSWVRGGKTTVGSGLSYTVSLADVGQTLQGSTSTTSATFVGNTVKAQSFKVAPALIAAPKLTLNRSTAVVGQKLAVAPGGGTSGATLKYQWYRNNSPIKGATAASYALVGADWGQRVGVKATVGKTNYTTASVSAFLAKDVGYGTLIKGKLTIKGKAKVGSKLTASRSGTATPGMRVTYQWYRNDTKIKGATRSTYTLGKADRGKHVSVRLFLNKQGYKSASLQAKTARVV